MKNFEPIFSLGVLKPPQDRLRSKLGGMPWGLSRDHWPQGMSLLAQLVHEPPMINLGGDYVLHLWHWSDYENYCEPPNYIVDQKFSLLVPRISLSEGLTSPPEGTRLFGEVLIEDWREFDDNMPADWLPLFYSSKTFREAQSREVGRIEFGNGLRTKFGGQPCCSVAGPDAIDLVPGELPFLFQTDGWIRINGQMPSFEEVGSVLLDDHSGPERITRKPMVERPGAPWYLMSTGKDNYIAVIADFASDGSAYVFIDRSTDPPTPRWTWSR